VIFTSSECIDSSTRTRTHVVPTAAMSPTKIHASAINLCFHHGRRSTFTAISKMSIRLCKPDDDVHKKPMMLIGATGAEPPPDMRSSSLRRRLSAAEPGRSSSAGSSKKSIPRLRARLPRSHPTNTSSGTMLRKNQNAIADAPSKALCADMMSMKRHTDRANG